MRDAVNHDGVITLGIWATGMCECRDCGALHNAAFEPGCNLLATECPMCGSQSCVPFNIAHRQAFADAPVPNTHRPPQGGGSEAMGGGF